MAVDAIIEVEGLRKVYGRTVAVDDLSFTVERGEIFAILGPNGAGKTTTVETLAGLRRPDAGRVRVLGLDPERHGPELRQRLGLQLQHAALPERLKVGEALELFASFYRRPRDWRVLLEQWDLGDKRDAAFAGLSGGQRQRLFIALALIGDPELVVLDELTAGLDPQARRATWDLVAAIRDAGTTVVLVTHFMDEAERLCDRLAIIDQGRIVARGTPAELIRPLAAESQVRFTAPVGFDGAWLHGVAGVSRVDRDGDAVVVHGNGPLMARVATALADRGLVMADLRTAQTTLEDVFLAVTGRRIRD
ncbi:MAG: ABC transporter ATP-binding protein [Actinomycetota bacterium]|nr:ABC transporter ATP-binding protein [Actinomycetota bacterium]